MRSVNIYQERTRETVTGTVADMPDAMRLLYFACGLGGEAGEVQEKLKKIIRDVQCIDDSHKEAVTKELGDVCWYIARIADMFEINFEDILLMNEAKLNDRKARGVLHGSGDNR